MRRVKGFTLIELIIVMATFSIIMFGALQLMDPVRKMFDNSYKNENISAAAQNITEYIENQLRYAEYVEVTKTQPTMESLRRFLNARYDGKLMADKTGAVSYASGELYVLKIDNRNVNGSTDGQGGKISRWVLGYTMGDLRAIGDLETGSLDKETFDTATRYLYYNTPTDKQEVSLPDPSSDYMTKLDAFDISAPDEDYAINKAFYSQYNYNVSLGIFHLDDDAKLAVDDEFYSSFGTDPSLQNLRSFGQENFGITVTAYPYDHSNADHTKWVTGRELDDEDSYYVYGDGTQVYTGSVSFFKKNMQTGKPYLHYAWSYDEASHARINTAKADDGTTYTAYTMDLVAGQQPECSGLEAGGVAANMSDRESVRINRAEADEIYIIYTYCGEDVNPA